MEFENFGVNATNHSKIIIDANNLSLFSDGFWSVTYQKSGRLITMG